MLISYIITNTYYYSYTCSSSSPQSTLTTLLSFLSHSDIWHLTFNCVPSATTRFTCLYAPSRLIQPNHVQACHACSTYRLNTMHFDKWDAYDAERTRFVTRSRLSVMVYPTEMTSLLDIYHPPPDIQFYEEWNACWPYLRHDSAET